MKNTQFVCIVNKNLVNQILKAQLREYYCALKIMLISVIVLNHKQMITDETFLHFKGGITNSCINNIYSLDFSTEYGS